MIERTEVPKTKIACIRNLWEKLNAMHYEDSVYFEDHFESLAFEKRIEPLMKIAEDDLRITVVKEGPRFLGYCVSIIEGGEGEIESLYLEEELRGRGLGRDLVKSHVDWMKGRGCARIRVGVSFGHDSATKFYHAMGFFERVVYFELKE